MSNRNLRLHEKPLAAVGLLVLLAVQRSLKKLLLASLVINRNMRNRLVVLHAHLLWHRPSSLLLSPLQRSPLRPQQIEPQL